MDNGMKRCIDEGCLERIETLVADSELTAQFQPIVAIPSGDVLAFEGLVRGPDGTRFRTPEMLFQCAATIGLVDDVEWCCVDKVIEAFATADINSVLFLNICSPAWLASIDGKRREHLGQSLISSLNAFGIATHQIVLEISETLEFSSYELLDTPLGYCRSKGVKVAIDDYGTGLSNLERCFQLQPEFIKVDKFLIEGIDTRSDKQSALKSLVGLARELQCELIAEGIETQAQLDKVYELGVGYGQGYFLGRPNDDFSVKKRLSQQPVLAHLSNAMGDPGEARSLVTSSPKVSPETPVSDVADLFSRNESMLCIPVVRDGFLMGIVKRADIIDRLAHPYGRSLHEKKAVLSFTVPSKLTVDASLSLEQVSKLITGLESRSLLNEIVILDGDQYLGVGRVKDLLERITNARVLHARHANPLTLLPGNLPLHRHIDCLLDNRVAFAIAYFDLNHFKPFNDYLGYSKGDEVICLVAELLQKYVAAEDGFISHIGGDDFMVVFSSVDWMYDCCNVIEAFDFRVKAFFPHDVLNAGGFMSLDREGIRCFNPLTSLSVGVVEIQPNECQNHHQVSSLAAKAKKQAKQAKGSAVYLLESR